MKTANLIVYALCACLLLTGCSTAGKDDTTPALGFTLKELSIRMNASAAPILAVLDGPLQYSETASCAFDGVEKTYYFGSFYLTTYPAEDGDRIGSVWFADDTVCTDEGIRIGSTLDEVEAQYGALPSSGAVIVGGNKSTLTIGFSGDCVTSILYEAIPD